MSIGSYNAGRRPSQAVRSKYRQVRLELLSEMVGRIFRPDDFFPECERGEEANAKRLEAMADLLPQLVDGILAEGDQALVFTNTWTDTSDGPVRIRPMETYDLAERYLLPAFQSVVEHIQSADGGSEEKKQETAGALVKLKEAIKKNPDDRDDDMLGGLAGSSPSDEMIASIDELIAIIKRAQ